MLRNTRALARNPGCFHIADETCCDIGGAIKCWPTPRPPPTPKPAPTIIRGGMPQPPPARVPMGFSSAPVAPRPSSAPRPRNTRALARNPIAGGAPQESKWCTACQNCGGFCGVNPFSGQQECVGKGVVGSSCWFDTLAILHGAGKPPQPLKTCPPGAQKWNVTGVTPFCVLDLGVQVCDDASGEWQCHPVPGGGRPAPRPVGVPPARAPMGLSSAPVPRPPSSAPRPRPSTRRRAVAAQRTVAVAANPGFSPRTSVTPGTRGCKGCIPACNWPEEYCKCGTCKPCPGKDCGKYDLSGRPPQELKTAARRATYEAHVQRAPTPPRVAPRGTGPLPDWGCTSYELGGSPYSKCFPQGQKVTPPNPCGAGKHVCGTSMAGDPPICCSNDTNGPVPPSPGWQSRVASVRRMVQATGAVFTGFSPATYEAQLQGVPRRRAVAAQRVAVARRNPPPGQEYVGQRMQGTFDCTIAAPGHVRCDFREPYYAGQQP